MFGGFGIKKKKSKTFSLIVNTLYMHGHNMASLGAWPQRITIFFVLVFWLYYMCSEYDSTNQSYKVFRIYSLLHYSLEYSQ